jgi:hypothetical protein
MHTTDPSSGSSFCPCAGDTLAKEDTDTVRIKKMGIIVFIFLNVTRYPNQDKGSTSVKGQIVY